MNPSWYFLNLVFCFSFRCFKAARVGETIEIDAQTLRRGKRLAFLTVDIRYKEGGVLLAIYSVLFFFQIFQGCKGRRDYRDRRTDVTERKTERKTASFLVSRH